ncbi:hypothetical protein MMC10_001899 [Thelotrema lepadinum]|nr:hypothetical protein [Thelotrema lepadinum]
MNNLTPAQLAQIPVSTPPPGVVPNFTDPPNNTHGGIAAIAIALGLMLIFVFLRVYTRLKVHKTFASEDWAAAIAALLTTALSADTIAFFAGPAVGIHEWDLHLSDLTISYETNGLVVQAFYPWALFFVKLSLFILILKIFGTHKKTLRYAIYGGIAVIGIFYLLCFILILYWCVPRPEDMGNLHASCAVPYEAEALNVALPAFDVLSDIYILTIPIPIVLKLHMRRSKRFGIIAIFMTGFLATICSILALIYRIQLVFYSTDKSWDSTPTFITNTIEANVGLICACLPCMPALWRRLSEEGGGFTSIRRLLSRITPTRRSTRGSPDYPSKPSNGSLNEELVHMDRLPQAGVAGRSSQGEGAYQDRSIESIA